MFIAAGGTGTDSTTVRQIRSTAANLRTVPQVGAKPLPPASTLLRSSQGW